MSRIPRSWLTRAGRPHGWRARPEWRLELLVIQPTPFCNLDCGYCYLPHRDAKRRISPQVLRLCFERVLASRIVRGPFTVVWHAGEPLTLPVGFYEDALALLGEVNTGGVPIDHSMQTNGTLIDAAWCAFLLRHRVKIGVSVDGPAFLHDLHRKTRHGRGTHDKVMRGIRCLQEQGVEFHVISVLTAASLAHPDAMFEFYAQNGIRRVGFNIEEIEGVNLASSLDRHAGAAERVRAFLERFLALVKGSAAPIEVRELEGLKQFLADGDQRLLCGNQENTPFSILNVDCDGNVSTFSPELLGARSDRFGDFRLGNVAGDDLDGIVGSEAFRRLRAEVERGIAGCRRSCEYFGLCGGGSPSNKFFENGSLSSTETMHCKLSKQAVVDVVLADLEASLGLDSRR
jgi:uncharacterized protein